MGSLPNIPTMDIIAFTSGHDAQAQRKTAQDFAEKCFGNGCLAITGHGISSEDLKQGFGVSKKLFDLPLEDKMKAPHPAALTPHRGYSGFGRELGAAKTDAEAGNEHLNNDNAKMGDYKESYEIGSDENAVEPNIWLPDDTYPGFRESTTELYWKLAAVANAVLEMIITSLDLDEKEAQNIRALHTGHTNQLRLLHYPSVPSKMGKDVSRLGAHTDWSSFTFLFQTSERGLEFLDRATGTYMPAYPKEGVLYMNVADMVTRLSNGRYPSAMHRVTVPEPDANGISPARYSIAYFVLPDPHGKIAPQASLVQRDGGEAKYEPITFQSYSEELFARVFGAAKAVENGRK